jgi:hypothetical protein
MTTATTDAELVAAELRARRYHARSPLDVPIWSLLIGEPDAGLAAIREMLADRSAEGSRFRAELAAIAGDWDAAQREARRARQDLAPTFVAGYRSYAAAMLSLIADEDDTARTHVADLDSAIAGRDKLKSGEPADIAKIPRGLVDRDADAVAAGVEAVLAWHLRRARVRSEVFNSSAAMISLDATVALALAHRRGLTIPVAAKYRAAELPMLAIHTSEWRGEPLARAMPFSVVSDLVAAPWLVASGVGIHTAAPRSSAPKAQRPARTKRRSTEDIDPQVIRHSLALREALGGNYWYLASWALLRGDSERARIQLWSAAEARARDWRGQTPPNANTVREHFGLALVIRDGTAIRDAGAALQRWMETAAAGPRYSHASGYLDVLCDVLLGRAVQVKAEEIGAPIGSTRIACLGVVARDPALVTRGLDGMLAEHAKDLERKSAPPAPVHQAAAQIAAAARGLRIPVALDARFAVHPVPVDVSNVPGYEGRVGRLTCDLLGRALWDV